MEDAEIVARLDRIAAILTLAFAPQLAAARFEIMKDDVSAGILDSSDDWISAGDLTQRVVHATGKAARSVDTRLAELRSSGVLVTKREGRKILYKNSGVL